MELHKRKHPRLKEYDYSQNGCYFVTICVKNRAPLLGAIPVGRDDHIPPSIDLSAIGLIADRFIQSISTTYKNFTIDKYVIMPNHIHLLITIANQSKEIGEIKSSPVIEANRTKIQTVIRSFKTMLSKQIGHSIWQDSFYDHVIRDEADCQSTWDYIDNNPGKWQEDELFLS